MNHLRPPDNAMKQNNNCASKIHTMFCLLCLFVAWQLFSTPVFAQPALQTSAGGTTVTVHDNSTTPPTDNNSDEGAISTGGSFPGWFFTSASGTTKPILGSANHAALDLLVSAQGLGTLTNTFSEQHFNSFTSRTLLATLNGGVFDSGSIVTARVYYGSALFDRSQLLVEWSAATPDFNFSTNMTLPALTNYSLTIEVVFDRNPAFGFPSFFGANLQVQLVRVANLTGSAQIGTNGPPAPGVLINLNSNSVPVTSTTTDANGQYQFQQVPFGDYTVAAESPDFVFSPTNRFVSIQSNANVMPFFGAPRLQIERANPAVKLSWAAAGTNLQLQRASAFPASWTNVTNPPTLQSGRLQVTLPTNPPVQFFRLIAP
jgi:hypothetical protein